MRLLVCGGRDFDDQDFVDHCLDRAHRKRAVTLLMEGGHVTRDRETDYLYGADWQAGTWAISRGVPHWICYANWFNEDGSLRRSAGPERNARMLEIGKPDGCVAFRGGPGTKNMISLCERAGIPVWKPYRPLTTDGDY